LRGSFALGYGCYVADRIAESSPEFHRMVKLQTCANTAAELAFLVGIPDDEQFRRSVTHHTQGTRELSPSREKLMRRDDSNVYYETEAQREKAIRRLEAAIKALQAAGSSR
jgi:hypothetical protein